MRAPGRGPAIVIPTYNEKENIVRLVRALVALPIEAHVIVVDDNSPDGTGRLLDEEAAREPRLHVVHRPGKLGLGTAHIAGMRKALAMGFEVVGTMDADFSHHPRYVPDLLAGIDRHDVMIGSRYVAGGAVNFGLHRKVLSRVANGFARGMLGLGPRDCTAGMRMYRRRVLDGLDLGAVFSNGYSFLVEVLYLVESAGWSVGEAPIVFEDREHGRSKISRTEIARAVTTVLRLAARGKRVRPGPARPGSGAA